jgi:hypothetical protein
MVLENRLTKRWLKANWMSGEGLWSLDGTSFSVFTWWGHLRRKLLTSQRPHLLLLSHWGHEYELGKHSGKERTQGSVEREGTSILRQNIK